MVCQAPHKELLITRPPQTNGFVEATNKTIFKLLKKKLGDRKGDWADDLPKVLWAYRTTKKMATEESPYALTFGTEAVIPTKIGSKNLSCCSILTGYQ